MDSLPLDQLLTPGPGDYQGQADSGGTWWNIVFDGSTDAHRIVLTHRSDGVHYRQFEAGYYSSSQLNVIPFSRRFINALATRSEPQHRQILSRVSHRKIKCFGEEWRIPGSSLPRFHRSLLGFLIHTLNKCFSLIASEVSPFLTCCACVIMLVQVISWLVPDVATLIAGGLF